ncbi:hypothetical protein K469DRAFT_688052 [Zopfia rhizophila CBS 207.26]|uniref:BZIP domain-containing protein n=1 Tax=Zopfia rhizophila CBS 207.26 TaxID=1314779 RepID=A0A6A6E3Z4_9PEZI|nr:hypothetical protein K469DRAFT_688052 [Zopfia rhizophila CBS 207.26]
MGTNMASDLSTIFPGPEDWNDPRHGGSPSKPPGQVDISLLIPHLFMSKDGYSFISGMRNSTDTEQDVFDGFGHEGDLGQVSAPLRFAALASYSSRVALTAMSTQTAGLHCTSTLISTSTFSTDGTSIFTDSDIESATSSNSDPWGDAINGEKHSQQRRRNSLMTDDAGSTAVAPKCTGRRHTSEKVEPGSARAIYLEKNRKAASKCRSKQKKQQEELVETARDAERKNKVLKAEVEFLTGDMRNLMEIVGKHMDRPDTRLRTYVQREANRLVAGGSKNLVAEIAPPKNGASPEKR